MFRSIQLECASSELQNIPRVLDRRDLHAPLEAEIGNFIFAGILRRQNFSFHTALAEPTGNQNAAQRSRFFPRRFSQCPPSPPAQFPRRNRSPRRRG